MGFATALSAAEPAVIELADPVAEPEWAVLERQLIDAMDRVTGPRRR